LLEAHPGNRAAPPLVVQIGLEADDDVSQFDEMTQRNAAPVEQAVAAVASIEQQSCEAWQRRSRRSNCRAAHADRSDRLRLAPDTDPYCQAGIPGEAR
jgi:hypothetical protein